MERQAARVRELGAVQAALLAWHAAHGLDAPWRDSADPYRALVAAVMAQQTQMSRVLASYERFIAAFPTLTSLAHASRGDVIRAWAGMGYNQRAVRLHNAAIMLDGEVGRATPPSWRGSTASGRSRRPSSRPSRSILRLPASIRTYGGFSAA